MKRLMPSSLVDFLDANRSCHKADCFLLVLPTGASDESGPSGPIGPYEGFVKNQSAYFDPASRTLYWIDSVKNVGNYWHGYTQEYLDGSGCHYPGRQGTPGCDTGDHSSFTITINVLGPDLEVSQIVTQPIPCGNDGNPDGTLVVTPDGFWIGVTGSLDQYRWVFVGADGSYEAVPVGHMYTGVNTYGQTDTLHDDNWGGDGTLGFNQPWADFSALYSPALGLVYIDRHGNISTGFHDNTVNQYVLGNTGSLGTEVTAAACSDGTNVWVLSQPNGDTNPLISKIDGSGVTNYSLPADPHDAYAIQYCAADSTLLYWIGNTLYKWDITTHAVLTSVTCPFLGSGPIADGALPNGLAFYDPITLAALPLTCDGTGLPSRIDTETIFQHWYDPDGGILWLQGDDKSVYGVRVTDTGGGGGGDEVVLLGATEGQWDLTIPEGTPGWSRPQTTFRAKQYGLWSRGSITSEASTQLQSNTMELDCIPQPGANYPGLDLGVLPAALNNLFDGATVWVFTVYMPIGGYGDVSAGVETKFRGTITKVPSLGRNKLSFECADPLFQLAMKIPARLMQSNCPWSFCDGNCDLQPSHFTVEFIADVTSTQLTLVPTIAFSQADGYFTQGVVTCLTGANKGLSQTVRGNVGGVLSLSAPWVLPVTAGDTFSVIKGCDKTLSTCKKTVQTDGSIVDNSVRFGGTPFVPAPTTAI